MSGCKPHFDDVGVVALVPEEWDTPWMSRHQILSRLARYFNIVWINPAREWRELWLHRSVKDNSIVHDSRLAPGFSVFRPGRWLPQLYRPGFLGRFMARERLRRAKRILRRKGCKRIVLYLWRPQYAEALDMIPHDLSCYHIVDEYTFSNTEKPISDLEAELISRVDQVFIHSRALIEKKGDINPHTLMVPNGVDYEAFSTPANEPADMKLIPRPRIGYIGHLKSRLNYRLLLQLARRHSTWSFVLVGPKRRSYTGPDDGSIVAELFGLPNFYYLGDKRVEFVPGYTQHMDVCIMNYKLSDFIKFSYPLKLHEYLATGHPVVATSVPSLLEFSQVIRIADTVDEWSQALADSLSPEANSAAKIEARRAVARKHDWHDIACLIARTFCQRLGPRYSERFDKLSIIGIPK